MSSPPVSKSKTTRIEVDRLPVNVQRYLSNHLLHQLGRHNWIPQTRDSGLLAGIKPPKFQIHGAHSDPNSEYVTQRYSEVATRFVRCIVLPETELGMGEYDVYGIVLVDHALALAMQDFSRENLDLGFTYTLHQLEAGLIRKVWYLKRPQPDNYIPEAIMFRNGKVNESGAEASIKLLHFCHIVKAREAAAKRYLATVEERQLDRSAEAMRDPEAVFSLL